MSTSLTQLLQSPHPHLSFFNPFGAPPDPFLRSCGSTVGFAAGWAFLYGATDGVFVGRGCKVKDETVISIKVSTTRTAKRCRCFVHVVVWTVHPLARPTSSLHTRMMLDVVSVEGFITCITEVRSTAEAWKGRASMIVCINFHQLKNVMTRWTFVDDTVGAIDQHDFDLYRGLNTCWNLTSSGIPHSPSGTSASQ